MATGIQLPQYCEDLDYPAIIDRYLINDLGIQGGVTTTNSFKIVAGSGLQVEAFDGGAFVPGGEGGTTGMYHISSLSTVSPYNNVEVPTTNPQIAQIILRVYDVNELKISGSSFARLEWLNGTPNALATEAKMKEGKFEGAASLPVSSFRVARILVPKNAITSSEYYIEDARTFSGNGSKTIATEESRENTAYGTLPNPDEVKINLPEGGLIGVAYQAAWKQSVSGDGRALLYLDSAAVGIANGSGLATPTAATFVGTSTEFTPISTISSGLVSINSSGFTSYPTTGVFVGAEGKSGGPAYLFASAGLHSVSVRFAATSGKVTVKERKLWTWVV